MTFEFEENGAKCIVSKPSTYGKGSKAWSMRTIKCTRGDIEVSASATCGGIHGPRGSATFELRIKDSTVVEPLLICEE